MRSCAVGWGGMTEPPPINLSTLYRRIMADFIGFYGEFYRGSMAGLSQEYRRKYGNVIAKAPPKYGDIMAPRCDKFIEILYKDPPGS